MKMGLKRNRRYRKMHFRQSKFGKILRFLGKVIQIGFRLLRGLGAKIKQGWKYYSVIPLSAVIGYCMWQVIYYRFFDSTTYISFKLPDDIKKAGFTDDNFSDEINGYLKWIYDISKYHSTEIDSEYVSKVFENTKNINSANGIDDDAQIGAGSISFKISGIHKLFSNRVIEGSITVDKDSSIICNVDIPEKIIEERITKELKGSYDLSLKLLSLQVCLDIIHEIDPIVYLKYLYNMGDKKGFIERAYNLLQSATDNNVIDNIHRELAGYYYDEGKFDSTLKYINVIEKKDPDDCKLLHLKGGVFLALKDTPQAIKCLKQSVYSNKKYSNAYIDLGNISIAKKSTDSALIYYTKFISLADYTGAPNYAGLANKAITYWQLGKYDSASYYEDRLRGFYPGRAMFNGVWRYIEGNYTLDPESGQKRINYIYSNNNSNKYACYYLGIRFLQKSSLDSAKLYFKKAVAIDANFTEAYLGLATAFYQCTDYILANEYYDAAFIHNGYNSDIFFGWLNNLLDQGNFLEAVDLANLALEFDPGNTTIRVLLGLAYQGEDNQKYAIYSLSVAYELAPHDEYVLRNFANYFISEGKPMQALNYLNLLLECDNKNWDAYNTLLTIDNGHSLDNKTEKYLLDMKYTFPDSSVVNKKLGLFYYDEQDYISSLDYFNLYIKDNQKDLEAYWYRSSSELYLGDFNACITDATYMISQNYMLSAGYSLRGQSQLRLGNFRSASKDFKMAVHLDAYDCNSLSFWETALNNLLKDKTNNDIKELLNDMLEIQADKLKANCNAANYIPNDNPNTGSLTGPAGLNR